MTFSQLFAVLRARYKLIAFMSIFVMASAVLLSLNVSSRYKSTASVIVNYKWADPISGLSLPPQLMPGYMATQADIIGTQSVARKVVDNLSLDKEPEFKKLYDNAADPKGSIQDWIAAYILKKVKIEPSRSSNVIDITFSGKNPLTITKVANGFATAYIQRSVELKVDPSRKAATYFTTQLKDLEDKLKKSHETLSNYQRDHGIINLDGSLDVENARLNDLSSQVVAAQSLAAEAASRSRTAKGSSSSSPEIASDPIVQSLKTQLSAAEQKMLDVSARVARNHPDYIAAQSQINDLRSALNRQMSAVSSTVSGNANILASQQAQLQQSLNSQRAKVLSLNNSRKELSLMVQDVATKQSAYDSALQRYNQNNFEGQSNQSDNAILNQASVPTDAYFPKLFLNILVALVLGPFSGIFLAIFFELLNHRIRTEDDLLSIIDAPLLGTISKYKINYKPLKLT